MNNAARLDPQPQDATELPWQITTALHVAFNLPEGAGLRDALGAPQATDNKDALFTWVNNQLRDCECALWTPLMNELVTRLTDKLRREEQLLWV